MLNTENLKSDLYTALASYKQKKYSLGYYESREDLEEAHKAGKTFVLCGSPSREQWAYIILLWGAGFALILLLPAQWYAGLLVALMSAVFFIPFRALIVVGLRGALLRGALGGTKFFFWEQAVEIKNPYASMGGIIATEFRIRLYDGHKYRIIFDLFKSKEFPPSKFEALFLTLLLVYSSVYVPT